MVVYWHKLAHYFNCRVQDKTLKVSDLVLHREEISQPSQRGKLSSYWEGPYQVEEVIGPVTFKQKQLDGTSILHP